MARTNLLPCVRSHWSGRADDRARRGTANTIEALPALFEHTQRPNEADPLDAATLEHEIRDQLGHNRPGRLDEVNQVQHQPAVDASELGEGEISAQTVDDVGSNLRLQIPLESSSWAVTPNSTSRPVCNAFSLVGDEMTHPLDLPGRSDACGG